MKTPSMKPASPLADDNEISLQPATPSSPAMQPNASLSNPRQTYNTGHGDFCFGRLVDRHELPTYVYPSDLSRGSNGAPVREMGDFQRVGSFKFFELPMEIRQKIYRLWLGPFYQWTSPTTQASFIPISFLVIDPTSKDELDRFRRRTTMTELEQKELAEHVMKPHPSRNIHYKITAYPKRDAIQVSNEDMRDYLFIEWIRQASNVGTQFRKELGDELWSNTKVQSQADWWHFVDFLKEHPAVHKGIKTLHLQLYFEDYLCSEKSPENLEVLLAYLEKTLTLDSLLIWFCVKEREIAQLVAGEGRFSYLHGFRKLRVLKSFEIYGLIDSFKDDQDFGAEEDPLWDKWKPAVLELLMPDTLRDAPAQSEIEKYLTARLPIATSSSPEST